MIESRLQTGHRRMMFSSQSSAQSTSSFSGGAETGIKRIVPHRGSVSDSDPPRSSPEAEPRLLKKIQLKEKYTFSPIASQRRFRRLAGYLRLCRQFKLCLQSVRCASGTTKVSNLGGLPHVRSEVAQVMRYAGSAPCVVSRRAKGMLAKWSLLKLAKLAILGSLLVALLFFRWFLVIPALIIAARKTSI